MIRLRILISRCNITILHTPWKCKNFRYLRWLVEVQVNVKRLIRRAIVQIKFDVPYRARLPWRSAWTNKIFLPIPLLRLRFRNCVLFCRIRSRCSDGKCSRRLIPDGFVECILNVLDFDLPKTREVPQLVWVGFGNV